MCWKWHNPNIIRIYKYTLIFEFRKCDWCACDDDDSDLGKHNLSSHYRRHRRQMNDKWWFSLFIFFCMGLLVLLVVLIAAIISPANDENTHFDFMHICLFHFIEYLFLFFAIHIHSLRFSLSLLFFFICSRNALSAPIETVWNTQNKTYTHMHQAQNHLTGIRFVNDPSIECFFLLFFWKKNKNKEEEEEERRWKNYERRNKICKNQVWNGRVLVECITNDDHEENRNRKRRPRRRRRQSQTQRLKQKSVRTRACSHQEKCVCMCCVCLCL